MVQLILWWTFAVLVAGAVFLVASTLTTMESGEEERGVKGFLADLRAGLATRFRRRPDDRARREAEAALSVPVDSDMDDFFAATQVDSPAYVDAEQLTETLTRARDRAARTLHVQNVSLPHRTPVPTRPAHPAVEREAPAPVAVVPVLDVPDEPHAPLDVAWPAFAPVRPTSARPAAGQDGSSDRV